MRTLSLMDKNTAYSPASDECWVLLAKDIMSAYAISYVNKFPLYASSQAEYDALDKKSFAPVRKSILRNIKNGPLRNAVDISAVYSALERERLENKRSFGIHWKETQFVDLDKL